MAFSTSRSSTLSARSTSRSTRARRVVGGGGRPAGRSPSPSSSSSSARRTCSTCVSTRSWSSSAIRSAAFDGSNRSACSTASTPSTWRTALSGSLIDEPGLRQQGSGVGLVAEDPGQLGALQRDRVLQRHAVARVAGLRDLAEDPLRGSRSLRSRCTSTSASPAKTTPSSWRRGRARSADRKALDARLVGAPELARPRPRRTPRAPDGEPRRSPRSPTGSASACSRIAPAAARSPAWTQARAVADGQERQQTGWWRCSAEGLHRHAEAADRFQRLPPVLVVLAPRALDQGSELTVGVGMGALDALQPLRRIVAPGQRDQARSGTRGPRSDRSR